MSGNNRPKNPFAIFAYLALAVVVVVIGVTVLSLRNDQRRTTVEPTSRARADKVITIPDEKEAQPILRGECGAYTPLQRTRFVTYRYEGEGRGYTLLALTTERNNRYFAYFVSGGKDAGAHYFIHTAHAARDGISPMKIPREAWDHALEEEGSASFLLMFDENPARSRLSDCKTWRPWEEKRQ